jgi:hypothetical protein
LLTHAEQVARELGYSDVRLYTNKMFEANVRLYLAFGYRVDREETSALGVTAAQRALVRACDDLRSFGHRSRLRQMGYDKADWEGKPVIGIINTWSDINPATRISAVARR